MSYLAQFFVRLRDSVLELLYGPVVCKPSPVSDWW